MTHGNTTHGHKIGYKGSPIYACWQAMKSRCYNKNRHSYPWYGAKGITVCPEWQDFAGFLFEMNASYFPGATLDRIDIKGNYCKTNCRWVTRQENSSRNSRTLPASTLQVILQEHKKGTSQVSIGKRFGISQGHVSNILKRLARGT